ncbi:hypothetical protein [Anaeroselena agilis]|uniref:Uncharacterized protein n=1 Tax=Anaeroselena agilis TaxID=3063788 RepID=A0ABU3NWD8_9FIRM|nr:hypothetical protein [Selenomonadales bacterium 4137-cl]
MAKAKEKQLSPEGEARLLAVYGVIGRIALRRLQREKAEQEKKDEQRPAG